MTTENPEMIHKEQEFLDFDEELLLGEEELEGDVINIKRKDDASSCIPLDLSHRELAKVQLSRRANEPFTGIKGSKSMRRVNWFTKSIRRRKRKGTN